MHQPLVSAQDLVHESIVVNIFNQLGVRSKCSMISACKHWNGVCSHPALWHEFDLTHPEDLHLEPCVLVQCLSKAKGQVKTVKFSCGKSIEAVEAENLKRFNSGYRITDPVPFTSGLRAFSLAALLPHLQHLAIDERTSCLGGMTNEFAAAVSFNCPELRKLEVSFDRGPFHQLPSELFTDEGLITLTEHCSALESILLHNCTHITDRSLYALAANCPGLKELSIGGFSERITDGGLTVLFQRCRSLVTVQLSSKLRRVTDASVEVLARSCSQLQSVKLSSVTTDKGLGYLAEGSAMARGVLREVQCRKSGGVSVYGVMRLVRKCGGGRLQVVVPAAVAAGVEQECAGCVEMGDPVGRCSVVVGRKQKCAAVVVSSV